MTKFMLSGPSMRHVHTGLVVILGIFFLYLIFQQFVMPTREGAASTTQTPSEIRAVVIIDEKNIPFYRFVDIINKTNLNEVEYKYRFPQNEDENKGGIMKANDADLKTLVQVTQNMKTGNYYDITPDFVIFSKDKKYRFGNILNTNNSFFNDYDVLVSPFNSIKRVGVEFPFKLSNLKSIYDPTIPKNKETIENYEDFKGANTWYKPSQLETGAPQFPPGGQSTTGKTTMGQLTTGKLTTEQSTTGQTTTRQSTTGQSTTGQSTTGQTTTGQSTTGQTTTGQTTTGQSTTGQSTTGQSTTGQTPAGNIINAAASGPLRVITRSYTAV